MKESYTIEDLSKAYIGMRKANPHLKVLDEKLEEATIRFYQQKGLFKPAGYEAKKAVYGEDTLWRIIFTRLAQRQSAQSAGEKATLDTLARWMYPKNSKSQPDIEKMEERLAAIRRVAMGEEKLSVEVLPMHQESDEGWSIVVKYRGVEIRAKRRHSLSMVQTQQLKIVAKLVESILEGS